MNVMLFAKKRIVCDSNEFTFITMTCEQKSVYYTSTRIVFIYNTSVSVSGIWNMYAHL